MAPPWPISQATQDGFDLVSQPVNRLQNTDDVVQHKPDSGSAWDIWQLNNAAYNIKPIWQPFLFRMYRIVWDCHVKAQRNKIKWIKELLEGAWWVSDCGNFEPHKSFKIKNRKFYCHILKFYHRKTAQTGTPHSLVKFSDECFKRGHFCSAEQRFCNLGKNFSFQTFFYFCLLWTGATDSRWKTAPLPDAKLQNL